MFVLSEDVGVVELVVVRDALVVLWALELSVEVDGIGVVVVVVFEVVALPDAPCALLLEFEISSPFAPPIREEIAAAVPIARTIKPTGPVGALWRTSPRRT